MVDKNISAECLKPELWTHLQEILDLYCPPVKILHILQKAEGFRAVTQNGEKVMLDSKSLEQPKGLLEAFPEIDEVRIYTEAAMDCYDKKLQAEEVSCVRPETQGDYFDLPAKEPYYTKEDLGKELEHLSAGLLSMDEEGTKDKIQEIFSHLSQEAMAKEQFKQVFSAFLYTLMQKNTTLIPIIAGYKLSDNDLAAQIKNQPHISQLRQKMEQILLLYMEQLKKQQEKKEEYVVKKAQAYMEKHFSEQLLLSDIAAQFHLHPNYFSSLFKKQLDMTVRDYILQLRMTKAKELMKDSSLKLLDIALAVGYEDAAHFNRAFKNVTGVSPSMYRDGIKKQ